MAIAILILVVLGHVFEPVEASKEPVASVTIVNKHMRSVLPIRNTDIPTPVIQQEVVKKMPEALAPLPALTPMPRTEHNVCYPGRKQTFYLHGVQRWRCLY